MIFADEMQQDNDSVKQDTLRVLPLILGSRETELNRRSLGPEQGILVLHKNVSTK